MRFHIFTLISLLAIAVGSPLSVTPLDPGTPISQEEFGKRQTPLNLFFAFILNNLPAINGPIDAVTGILTSFENLLAFLTNAPTTYNDLNGACKPYTVLFARGTTEPGNVGILVGPPFFEALKQKVGSSNLAIQGVNGYDADVEGYLAGGDKGGSTMMASQITAAKAKCPNTKLIISGYSQGGQIVHNAASLISTDVANWVSKVVIFGDPLSLKPVAKINPTKVKVFCHVGDAICLNGAVILPPHLTYGIDAVAAAAFATS